MVRVLLAGAPRSGTSWTAGALGRCAGARLVDEPDGFRDAFAFRTMMQLGENPRLAPGAAAPDYERLWAGVFAGGAPPRGPAARLAAWTYHRAGTDARRRARAEGRPNPWLRIAVAAARPPVPDPGVEHVVAKSVQCARSIEWIVDRFAPTTVVLARHPLNAIASWRELGFVRNARENASLAEDARARWGVTPPGPDAPRLAHQAFVYAVTASALAEAAARHPDWVTVRHEDLCRDAPTELRALAERLGLVWTDAAADFVARSDRQGSGFVTARVAAQQEDRWRERLDAGDVEVVRAVLAGFPAGLLSSC
jgi:hypothetical protein